MKQFRLWFAFRDENNILSFRYETIQAKSQKAARDYGKASEDPSNKLWFRGLVPATKESK